MSLIDRTGTFLATIAEAAYGETKKGFPQFVAKFVATKRYVVDKAEMAALQPPITEPGWVDWNYSDELMGYLVLFNDSGPLKNFEQIQTATGWSGADFQELATLVGKSVLIRVEENTWDGKTSLQVSWIDAPDASPERSIKQADAPTIAAANNKWLAGRKQTPKPTVKAALPANTTPAVPSPAPAPTAAVPPAAVAPTAAKNPPGRRKQVAAPAPTAGVTQAEAWDAVIAENVRGKVSASEVEEMWITRLSEVAGATPPGEETPEHFAKTRDLILKDLAEKNKV